MADSKQQQQESRADRRRIAELAAALTAASAASAAPAVLALLLPLLIPRTVVVELLLMLYAHPPAQLAGFGPAGRAARRQAITYRAAYLLNASRRVATAARKAAREASAEPPPEGKTRRQAARDAARDAVRQALTLERRYYAQHRQAEENRARAAARTDFATLAYGPKLAWHSVRDSRTTRECRVAHGGTYTVTDPPLIGLPGTVHVHCLPGWVEVASPSLRATSMRWYEGELIELTTSGGHNLAVTPNHPILTTQGWVAANLVDEGREVVSTRFAQAVLDLIDPYDHEQPALIEDVVRTFSERFGVLTRAVPVTPEDFHGDGGGSEIAVVRANGVLMDDADPSEAEPRGVKKFGRVAGDSPVALSGALAAFLPRPGPAPDGIMRGRGVAPVFFGAAGRHHDSVRVGGSSPWDLVTLEDRSDAGAGDAIASSEFVLAGASRVRGADVSSWQVTRRAGFFSSGAGPVVGGPLVAPGPPLDETVTEHALRDVAAVSHSAKSEVARLIQPDRVVKVRKWSTWRGHVFNLESVTGSYIANGIVTHNCRCIPVAAKPGAPTVNEKLAAAGLIPARRRAA